jgi:type IV secretory pathway TraG/TraD family ATPase VirD4
LGEDSAALLGCHVYYQNAINRYGTGNMPEDERKDFYLYVDEFQNFATTSFIKILSEARKYRLNLVLANQYVGQVEEDIQKAIFGMWDVGNIFVGCCRCHYL